MSANTSAPGVLGSKEGLKNPSLVNIEDVGLVLGKGIGALHLRSGYGTKNFPTFFEYGPATMDEVASELGKYKVEPKVFQGTHNAAGYIRDNSMFATDTYVLELPGDIVVVYQLTLIREIYDSLVKKFATGSNVKKIIDFVDNLWGEQYDKHGVRRSEWMGVDGNGRRVDPLYIDTSGKNDRMTEYVLEIPLNNDFIEIGFDHRFPTRKDFRDE